MSRLQQILSQLPDFDARREAAEWEELEPVPEPTHRHREDVLRGLHQRKAA